MTYLAFGRSILFIIYVPINGQKVAETLLYSRIDLHGPLVLFRSDKVTEID